MKPICLLMHDRKFMLMSFLHCDFPREIFVLYGKGRKQFHLHRTIVVSVTGN